MLVVLLNVACFQVGVKLNLNVVMQDGDRFYMKGIYFHLNALLLTPQQIHTVSLNYMDLRGLGAVLEQTGGATYPKGPARYFNSKSAVPSSTSWLERPNEKNEDVSSCFKEHNLEEASLANDA